MSYYDRYSRFRGENSSHIMPNVEITPSSTDITVIFKKDTMRMDTLSYKYYNDANYGWLIMMANPSYGSLEYSIPDGVVLRIPYPLNTAINRYENVINNYIESH